MWQKLRKQEGFTLIELVVVVAILGLLAVIVTPKVMGAIENAKNNSNMSSAKQIQVAMERYNAEKGSYPAGKTLCGSSWDGGTTKACPLATMKTTLGTYVNLDTATINDTVTYETPTNAYILVVTFEKTSKAYTIAPDSITTTP